MLHLYTGSLAPATGSDDFRLREAYHELRARLDADGMLATNTIELPVRGLTPAELVQQLSALPFLAAARLVRVDGLIAAAGTRRGVLEQWQPLLDCLVALPPTNHLALLEPAPARDDRMTLERSPLFRALRALPGVDVQEFRELRLYRDQRDSEVAHWLLARAAAHGIAIERPAAEALTDLLGANLQALASELDKLATHACGRPITAADVHALTPAAREGDLFALIDAAVEGRSNAALQALQQVLASGTQSVADVQRNIARQLRNLVRASELLEQGAGEPAIGEATGVAHPYARSKLVRQARSLARPAAEAGLRRVEEADHDVKTGRLDELVALELLIYSLGSLASRSAVTPRDGQARVRA